MSLSERELSMIETVGNVLGDAVKTLREESRKALAERDERIEKLERDVEGLISLLGE